MFVGDTSYLLFQTLSV